MDHERLRRLAAGAALDDLDRDERIRFEAHRAGCRSCGSLVEDLLDLTADLAALAPQRPVPVALRASVLAAVAAAETPTPSTQSSVQAAAGPSGTTGPRVGHLGAGWARHRLFDLGAVALAASFAFAAVGLVSRDSELAGQLSQSRAAADVARAALATQSGAMAVAVDPAHRTVALHPEPGAPAASAVVMYVPGTTASYVMASDLPATPAGSVYQLWVADARGVHGLGTYQFDGRAPFVAPLGVDLAGATATMITLEHAGGAKGEPGPQVVFGQL